MTTTHTPGSWTVDKYGGIWSTDPTGAFNRRVASVNTDVFECGDNARLIAEAPAMRDELEKAADTFHEFVQVNRALYRHALADAADIAERSIRVVLARIEGKG